VPATVYIAAHLLLKQHQLLLFCCSLAVSVVQCSNLLSPRTLVLPTVHHMPNMENLLKATVKRIIRMLNSYDRNNTCKYTKITQSCKIILLEIL